MPKFLCAKPSCLTVSTKEVMYGTSTCWKSADDGKARSAMRMTSARDWILSRTWLRFVGSKHPWWLGDGSSMVQTRMIYPRNKRSPRPNPTKKGSPTLSLPRIRATSSQTHGVDSPTLTLLEMRMVGTKKESAGERSHVLKVVDETIAEEDDVKNGAADKVAAYLAEQAVVVAKQMATFDEHVVEIGGAMEGVVD
ncbi:hypothetical protein L3X38_032629 [Prunus dulcis]|uniref:Uncharacterized protein n=1 Tax=Prunus dulcis TaxID=3755 RepID=A0AAD4YV46_PRUDU|nr:hypothetical protein L3X38_032629 [Prunus dulcis]